MVISDECGEAFDFDNNGPINAADYNQFRSRFGRTYAYA
jgi:hypothetical protein